MKSRSRGGIVLKRAGTTTDVVALYAEAVNPLISRQSTLSSLCREWTQLLDPRVELSRPLLLQVLDSEVKLTRTWLLDSAVKPSQPSI